MPNEIRQQIKIYLDLQQSKQNQDDLDQPWYPDGAGGHISPGHREEEGLHEGEGGEKREPEKCFATSGFQWR